MNFILTTVSKIIEKSGPIVLGTIIKTQGSTPQVTGVSAVFNRDGLMLGTLGGGVLEGEAQSRALEAWNRKESILFDYSLDADIDSEEGAICGGSAIILLEYCDPHHQDVFKVLTKSIQDREAGTLITFLTKSSSQCILVERIWMESRSIETGAFSKKIRPFKHDIQKAISENSLIYLEHADPVVFIQPLIPLPRLVIAGAGHIGKALAHLGNLLEFEVTVIDDRKEFCNSENIPDAHHLVVSNIGDAIRLDPKTEDTYLVIVTRGHRDDSDALRNAIDTNIAYLGMIGSRTKIALMKDQFINKGWATQEQLDQVHAPIGLEIQSKTVQEIAISIAAQLVLVRQLQQNTPKKPVTSAIILAAGESRRMGKPKQLLPFGDSSMIEMVIETVGKTDVSHTIVVLGSHYEAIVSKIKSKQLVIARNENFKNGMLSSLQAGLKKLPHPTGKVLVLLGDQPMMQPGVINRLIDAASHSEKNIAVAVHQGKWGHPVLIDVTYTPQIEALGTDQSLHDFLKMHRDDILEVEVDHPEIHRDIDTIEDYNKELKYRS